MKKMAESKKIWDHTDKQDADGKYVEIYYTESKKDKQNTEENTESTEENTESTHKNIENTENAEKYIFEVRRYKITTTKEEYLNVKVYEIIEWDENDKPKDRDECAEIEKVSIVDLERQLLNLRTYGVIMERKHFPKVRQEIEKVYTSLTKRYVDDNISVTNKVILSVYDAFVRFIKEVGLEAEKELYNISVVDFKEHLLDSEFSKYKYSDIRAGLAQLEISVNGISTKAVKCSYGRKDNTVKIGNKLVKVISFVAKAVDYRFTNLPEGNT